MVRSDVCVGHTICFRVPCSYKNHTRLFSEVMWESKFDISYWHTKAKVNHLKGPVRPKMKILSSFTPPSCDFKDWLIFETQLKSF